MPLIYSPSTGQITEGTIPPGGSKVLSLVEGVVTEVYVDGAAPPVASGDTVVNERLTYDRPEVVPRPSSREALIPRASESVPLLTEEVIAALLARAEEDFPRAQDTIRTTAGVNAMEAHPTPAESRAIALRANEFVPTIGDSIRLEISLVPEVLPTVRDDLRITAGVNANESVPQITENVAAAIIEQDNFLNGITTTEPLNANLTGYANQNVATTTWANPANALGNTTGTAATLTATASGLAGTTNNTVTGSMTLGFRDVNLGDLTITSVILRVENQGATAGVAIAQPTTNVQWQYSFDNGANFTTFYTMTTPATAKGIRSVNVTALVGQDQAKLSGLQIRATGTITSGTGLGAGNTVSFFRAWMEVLANRTY